MYLIDSSILIDAISHDEKAITLLEQLSLQSLYISTIAWIELHLGFALLPTKANRDKEVVLRNLVKDNNIRILPVNEKVSSEYIKIQNSLYRIGKALSRFDCLIAATAVAHDLVLVTSDQDFGRVEGLRIYKSSV